MVVVVAFLNIVSSPGPGLVRLVTRWVKTRFGQVGDKVSQVKDQVGQGQGQELDNIWFGKVSGVGLFSSCDDFP